MGLFSKSKKCPTCGLPAKVVIDGQCQSCDYLESRRRQQQHSFKEQKQHVSQDNRSISVEWDQPSHHRVVAVSGTFPVLTGNCSGIILPQAIRAIWDEPTRTLTKPNSFEEKE